MKKLTKAILKKRERRLKRRLEKQKFIAWREAILARDNYADQITSKQQGNHSLQVHHILSKDCYPELKFDVMNGISLSFYSHKNSPLSPHLNGFAFVEWFRNKFPERYEYLLKKLKEHDSLKKI